MENTATTGEYGLFVGVDIAAATALVVWLPAGGKGSRPVQIAQTPQGYKDLQTHLQASGVPPAQTLVVMEATGSYGISLATALSTAGYAVSVINPSQAHTCAKALLKRAKTEASDAQTSSPARRPLAAGALDAAPGHLRRAPAAPGESGIRCSACANRCAITSTRCRKERS